MTKAEEKSIVYQLATHGPRVMGGAAILSEEDYKFWNINYDFKAGYEEAEKDLGWHPATELPPVDEEVIVLRTFVTVEGVELGEPSYVSFGHIVDKNVAVDYNGWNVPGVKYWMPCPKIPEE